MIYPSIASTPDCILVSTMYTKRSDKVAKLCSFLGRFAGGSPETPTASPSKRLQRRNPFVTRRGCRRATFPTGVSDSGLLQVRLAGR